MLQNRIRIAITRPLTGTPGKTNIKRDEPKFPTNETNNPNRYLGDINTSINLGAAPTRTGIIAAHKNVDIDRPKRTALRFHIKCAVSTLSHQFSNISNTGNICTG
jgi:hypothetical protein